MNFSVGWIVQDDYDLICVWCCYHEIGIKFTEWLVKRSSRSPHFELRPWSDAVSEDFS